MICPLGKFLKSAFLDEEKKRTFLLSLSFFFLPFLPFFYCLIDFFFLYIQNLFMPVLTS